MPIRTMAQRTSHPDNLVNLRAFVTEHIRIASEKPTKKERNEHLQKWIEYLEGQIKHLGEIPEKKHLIGITAFDMTEETLRLIVEVED